MASKSRAPLSAGLARGKPQENASTVGEAPMDLEQVQGQTEEAAPVLVVVESTPAPVKEEVTAQPTAQPASTEPAPQEPQQIVIASPQTVAPQVAPESIKPVVISAPVHPRQVKADQIQLSIRVKGDLLARFEEAKYKTGIKGQDIATEALAIWLAHNGF